jgi:hypothetical protein
VALPCRSCTWIYSQLAGRGHGEAVGLGREQVQRSREGKRGRTSAGVLRWDRSAATPGVLAISYSDSEVTSGFIFTSMDSGCPMPPAAPSTATCTHQRRGPESELRPPAVVRAWRGKRINEKGRRIGFRGPNTARRRSVECGVGVVRDDTVHRGLAQSVRWLTASARSEMSRRFQQCDRERCANGAAIRDAIGASIETWIVR